jgi:butyryl-CoA dehydrogenase
MARLAGTEGLTEFQQEILDTVRRFVDKEILPYATDLEHKDEFPEAIVDGMREMGLFGLMIPEEHGGLGESLLTYALVVEQVARGWMSVSGVINTHFIVAYMLMHHGTPEQQQRLLPRMATGELRGGFSMSEPGCGSDVAAITSRGVRDGDEYVLDGQKMWLTNGARAGLIATLVKTDEGADSVYQNMSTFLVEKEPGYGQTAPGITIPGKIEKMGYKGVETTEMVMEGARVPASSVLGGEAGRGRGFYQMMDGVEVGRVNVAARACGISIRAFELAIAYAQQHGQAARVRVLLRGHAGLLPDPRRLRLLQGVRDRAAHARGAVPAHRGGHQRDPEDDHLPRAAEGVPDARVTGPVLAVRCTHGRVAERVMLVSMLVEHPTADAARH